LLASRQHNQYDIHLLLCIQYYTPDDGQKTCPKHVEFCSKNKFDKLVHLVGFIIRIYLWDISEWSIDIPLLMLHCCGVLDAAGDSLQFTYTEVAWCSIFTFCHDPPAGLGRPLCRL